MPDVVLVVDVVVMVPAPVPDVPVEPFCAPGLDVPPLAAGKSGAEEPAGVGVNGWTGAASGAAPPVSGNGLNALIPVAGVGGAFPTTGDGLNVVGDVANGADPPTRGNGLKMLPPETKDAVAPDTGNGLKTLLLVVRRGVDAPENWNGLKTLLPLVTFVCPTVDVVIVVCWNVAAPADLGSSPAAMNTKRTKKVDLLIVIPRPQVDSS